MDGFVKMINEGTEVGLLALSLFKETLLAISPKEAALTIKYGWDGLMGLSNWMGYALSASYYIALDFGFGE